MNLPPPGRGLQVSKSSDGSREWNEYSWAFAGQRHRRGSPARELERTKQGRAQSLPTSVESPQTKVPKASGCLAPQVIERGELNTARRGNLTRDDCVGTGNENAGRISCEAKPAIARYTGSMDLRCQKLLRFAPAACPNVLACKLNGRHARCWLR